MKKSKTKKNNRENRVVFSKTADVLQLNNEDRDSLLMNLSHPPKPNSELIELMKKDNPQLAK